MWGCFSGALAVTVLALMVCKLRIDAPGGLVCFRGCVSGALTGDVCGDLGGHTHPLQKAFGILVLMVYKCADLAILVVNICRRSPAPPPFWGCFSGALAGHGECYGCYLVWIVG